MAAKGQLEGCVEISCSFNVAEETFEVRERGYRRATV